MVRTLSTSDSELAGGFEGLGGGLEGGDQLDEFLFSALAVV